MEHIYLVQHCYEVNDVDEIKLIGIFSTEELANNAINDLIDKPGFKTLPKECFTISNLKIDEYSWKDGFISWEEG